MNNCDNFPSDKLVGHKMVGFEFEKEILKIFSLMLKFFFKKSFHTENLCHYFKKVRTFYTKKGVLFTGAQIIDLAQGNKNPCFKTGH